MIYYRKHIIKYDSGFWHLTRAGKGGSVEHETLTEAKGFVDEQCSQGLSKHRKGRYYT